MFHREYLLYYTVTNTFFFLQSTYHPVYQQNHHIKKDTDSPNGTTDAQDLANKMANLYTPRTEDSDALKDFAVSKNDPKYQTLPYNTKFTVNLLPNRIPSKGDVVNSSEQKDDVNSHVSSHVNGHFNMQSAHMTVHSAPLSVVNKNIATPLNQHDLLSRKASDGKDHGEESNGVGQQKENTYPSTTSINTSGTTYQVIKSKIFQILCFLGDNSIFFFRNRSAA